MPSRSPPASGPAADLLAELGWQLRAHRKAMRISATTAAEAAGMSRVTLHRIESGEPSVTMGAYQNAAVALGLKIGLSEASERPLETVADDRHGWIPVRIRLADYPQLKRIAWQIHGADELTPSEALSIYERNWRHVEANTLEPRERNLIDALRLGIASHGNV